MRKTLNPPRPFGSLLLAAAATLTPIHVQAQNSVSSSGSAPQQFQSTTNFFHTVHPQTSFSLGTFGQFTPTRIESTQVETLQPYERFLTSGASPTVGILGTFRQQFRPWLGYSVNMGYTRVTQRYTQFLNTSNTYDNYDVKLNSNMYELSLSYVGSKQITPRMSGFVEAGSGVLTFLPVVPASRDPLHYKGLQNALYFANVNFVPETVGGVGFHWHLANSFGLRVEYRGLIYTNTPFGYTLHKAMTISSEPTVSLTYSFGHK